MIHDEGRHIEIDLHPCIKSCEHDRNLRRYTENLFKHGITRINCDHIRLDFLDKTLNVNRGNRKIDLVYYKDDQIFECELKTKREVGLDRTYTQLKDQAKHCQNLIMLVPREQVRLAEENLKILNINNVIVDSYD